MVLSSAIVCDHDRRIADDRRSSFHMIADLIAICDPRSYGNQPLDRTWFYLLRSSAITIAGSQTIADLIAICDPRSYGNQPLVLNLAGPAEDFCYSLPADGKGTFAQLRDELRERFSNDNQSGITWQAISTRQQGALDLFNTYLTDLTNKFRRLNIAFCSWSAFVLLRQPTTSAKQKRSQS